MHSWGGGFKYFKEVAEAADWIGCFLRRWGRMHVTDTKEKWGTARVYVSFGWDQFHTITHPGHVHHQYPPWLWRLDCIYLSKAVRVVNVFMVPFHRWLYRRAYKLAIAKWPIIREEIIRGADHRDLLKGL